MMVLTRSTCYERVLKRLSNEPEGVRSGRGGAQTGTSGRPRDSQEDVVIASFGPAAAREWQLVTFKRELSQVANGGLACGWEIASVPERHEC